MNDNQLAQQVTLCDALDRILNSGVVLYGDITISVAGVDLLYVGIRGLISAVDALEKADGLGETLPSDRKRAEI